MSREKFDLPGTAGERYSLGMADLIPDLFADAFRVQIAALGCSLTFRLSISPADSDFVQKAAGELPSKPVAVIRLTPELLKGMTFILRENIRQYEQAAGAKIVIPPDIMASVLSGSDRATWDRVWGDDST